MLLLMLLIAQITTQKWSNLWRKMCIMACINKLIQILRCLHRTGWIKTRPSRNCSYEWNSQVTRTRTELASMWTAAIGIHANSCITGTRTRVSGLVSMWRHLILPVTAMSENSMHVFRTDIRSKVDDVPKDQAVENHRNRRLVLLFQC